MGKEILTHYEKRNRSTTIVTVFAFCLPTLAMIIACYVSFFSRMAIPIEKPAIMVLGAFFILMPFRPEAVTALQKIVSFYLICVQVNELSSQHLQVSFLPGNVSISYTSVVLALCAIGYLIRRVNSNTIRRPVGKTDILIGWELALLIMIAHMLLLSLILNKFYGYGYERNLGVLGNLCLYFLLFILLWDELGRYRFRLCAGLILAVFYLAAMATKAQLIPSSVLFAKETNFFSGCNWL